MWFNRSRGHGSKTSITKGKAPLGPNHPVGHRYGWHVEPKPDPNPQPIGPPPPGPGATSRSSIEKAADHCHCQSIPLVAYEPEVMYDTKTNKPRA